jgi:alpha-N-arabinofuranosidase
MANVAQLVNCLHSLFLADGDRFVPTPTFHVFQLYKPHVGGQAVRTVWSAPPIGYTRVNAEGSLRGVAGSASLHDRTLTLTVVNPHISEPLTAEIGVRGRSDGNVTAMTIAEADVHAHNTFDRPEAVRPRAVPAQPMRAGVIVHSFAPASVTRLTVAL